ncbi:hypothetical protein [Paenibacillus sp. LHD-38]|uniref:hypothetical protein n=1 Tax=Paenibacillus sp. LHD-38 TaxID=3072143 RepID=UPI00280E57AD|nr:hypothetical protein [Paenibacillus sp. LHD-38]MDQ8733986.1 hypothetical protein [Paenibacillus sp. LHD-38]
MSLKLNGVSLVKNFITNCSHCNVTLISSKKEVMYRSREISKSTYLLTDIWFCEKCLHGYVHESFQHTIDPYGKKWAISIVSSFIKKIEPQLSQSKEENSTHISKSSSSNRLLIQQITKILPNNIDICDCRTVLKKTKISLVMKSLDNKNEIEVKTVVLICPLCKNVYMNEVVYSSALKQHKTFRIIVESTQPIQPQNYKKHKLSRAQLIERDNRASAKKKALRSTGWITPIRIAS